LIEFDIFYILPYLVYFVKCFFDFMLFCAYNLCCVVYLEFKGGYVDCGFYG